MCCRLLKAQAGDHWAYGEINDKQGGLWAVLDVVDPEPHRTFSMAENGESVGVPPIPLLCVHSYVKLVHYIIVNNLNLAHIVAGKDLWLTVIVRKVFQDACLPESMMFKVEVNESDADDEYPEHCTEPERYVHMCTLNLCSCGGIRRYLSAMMKDPKAGYVLCTETITVGKKVVLPLCI
jgi:hypothetical protein